MELNRRKLITGLVSFMAAPAIIRAGSLMPVKQMNPLLVGEFSGITFTIPEEYTQLHISIWKGIHEFQKEWFKP